ncbi:1-(5-phosphoribosyl)-5-[(5-phosphoribosylamino)methylideneamino] imidazole-4-carboxamide isomerase [Sphingosinicella sp. YJ22]|uniref:1-(5-phosphoribosyl)-5-[(5- phosphoribosylamino)methylideneamino]imidazole-4- carboxamide isomerase n=1 Tax=Sphingosinicella sp. YJ22 TaxID=1104780 RepID=UPI00140858C5|nr:1-(5-phosphoribosyl)-5-[(5-phosphoribosylamino)methylideneamino] imidazole-4-carboxamide isomerase [Sphingosinicella sp. YJ22]
MILYPAMDLMGGRVVRLRQGRFDDATAYAADPAEALAEFAAAGAEWAHVVDLDGARAGEPVQHDLIARLAGTAKLKLQVGGGFRTRDQVARMLDFGVARVVIGSLTVKQPNLVRAFFEEFGAERITLSLDVRIEGGMPLVVASGWTEKSALSLWEAAALYPEARHILLTDVGRDGMLAGPNFALLEEAVKRLPAAQIQASGGVSSLDDLRRLGTAGTIVGKAIWDGRFTLAEALDACA